MVDDPEFQRIYKEYEQEYDLTGLNKANDKLALEQLIANQLLIQRWQRELRDVVDPIEVQKRTQAIAILIRSCQDIERQLRIDRKSRVGDSDMSVTHYIAALQEHAKQFLDERIQRLYCPRCNVLVFRYAPVHDHTSFLIETTCASCGQAVRLHRSAKGELDDLPPSDREWRYRHPVVVRTPDGSGGDAPPILTIDDNYAAETKTE